MKAAILQGKRLLLVEVLFNDYFLSIYINMGRFEMNVYVVKTNKRIYPFMDKTPELLISNKTLADLQEENIRYAGCKLVKVDRFEDIEDKAPHIVFYDNLCISAQAIRLIIKEASGRKEGFVCAVDDSYYIDSYLWHLDKGISGVVPLQLYFVVEKGVLPEKIQIIHFECKKFERERMPPHMESDGKGFDIPLTNVIMIPIENWVNLWQANMGMLMLLAYQLEFTRLCRRSVALIRARGSRKRAPLYLNKIGKNCDIHPSAVIEASIIGNNVHIGANAVVRLCVIADNAYISDQALLRVCNIGHGSYIANNNNVAFSVTYSDSFLISGPYQFSIFGKECAIMHCIDCDCRLDGHNIRADTGGGILIDTKQKYLGSCYGHRARVGAGTISAPGSAVPNNVWINPNPAMVMSQFDSVFPVKKNLFLSGGRVITKERLEGGS